MVQQQPIVDDAAEHDQREWPHNDEKGSNEDQRWPSHNPNPSDEGPYVKYRGDSGVTIGEKFLATVRYSSLYLAFIASLQALISIWILSVPLNLAPAVIGLVTFAVYSTDRIADAESDVVAKPRQAEFARRHADVLYLVAALAYSVAVALSILGGPLALLITLLPGLFWLLYASDWIPESTTGFRRLKDVLFVNTAVVALAWAFTLTFLPLAFANAQFTPAAGFAFAYFFLGVVVSTEIPNVRDVREDTEIGVSTVPVVFGVRRTRHLLCGVGVVLLLLVGLAVQYGLIGVPLGIGLAVGTAYSLVLSGAVGHTDRYNRLTVAVESQYVVAAVIAVVATIL
ncbi:4-hydroxybenzoate polyprenyltransferase or related prenyltransferase [Halalkaliarchaeum sp. AArc-CO]|uniref:UbiA family prenyltransferase n=1 Tax=Halalkaliarchaeum sp. AArc-CO TaxID=2866381 RepID=UPI00217F0234|nr:UbiA family prenyltransferase [Halalkaliarchaeum sp. AArc-CO]UWG49845.1 4-hydroxybenzoate polyprenyltransferase or related prenyltransferase [Halalkaliarchaeum sp. AArc-CO]